MNTYIINLTEKKNIVIEADDFELSETKTTVFFKKDGKNIAFYNLNNILGFYNCESGLYPWFQKGEENASRENNS